MGIRGHLSRSLLFLLLGPRLEAQGSTVPAIQQPPQDLTAVISGMVIREEDSAPLRGATVQLENSVDRDHTIAALTASDGHIALHNLPACSPGNGLKKMRGKMRTT